MPILIRGETGTGKEELARHAHVASGRKGAFVALNCAAMPESLIEAELFGYVEGAFTGARRGGSQGLVKEADHGTLFLDEIGDMPISLQPVLLRFLDDWTARPIGGSNHMVDVFLISATNAKLDRADCGRPLPLGSPVSVEYSRCVAAVARRDEQILSQSFGICWAQIDPLLTISDEAIAHLAARRWPGNIRELRNMLPRLSLSAIDNRLEYAEAPPTREAVHEPAALEPDLWEMQKARILAALQGNARQHQ